MNIAKYCNSVRQSNNFVNYMNYSCEHLYQFKKKFQSEVFLTIKKNYIPIIQKNNENLVHL